MKNLMWALMLGVVLMADVSVATDLKYKNTTGDGKWETIGNWSPSQLPGPADQVRFGETSTNIVATLSTVSTILRLQIGVDNNGFCVIDGGTLTTLNGWNGLGAGNGFVAGKTASLTIKNGGSLTVATAWRMGVSGPGGGTVILTMLGGTLTTPGFEQNYNGVASTILKGGTLIVNGSMIVNYGTIEVDGGKIVIGGDQTAFFQGLIASGRMVTREGYYIVPSFDGTSTTVQAVPEPTNIPLLGLGVLTNP